MRNTKIYVQKIFNGKAEDEHEEEGEEEVE